MTIPVSSLEPGYELPSLKKVALNTWAAEKGSIHDDEEARKHGFAGGLVLGATSFAYVTELMISSFGPPYFETGRLKLQYARPVYSSQDITVKGVVERIEPEEGGQRIHLEVWIENPAGDRCVRGTASVRLPVLIKPELDKLEIGQELNPYRYRIDVADVERHLESVGVSPVGFLTDSPWGRPVVPPGMFAMDTDLLTHLTFDYNPGVHVSSDMEYLAPAFVGKAYTCRGWIVDKYNRKGNDYMVVEAVTVDEDGREIARNRHATIFRLGK
ncbi:MAG: MaoC family dehydratase [Chloroflexi bacterium]|nr:MaoC family dehydratase [Chloroflexota bacterium]